MRSSLAIPRRARDVRRARSASWIIVLGGLAAFVALSLLQAIYGVDASAFR